jgi:hypothetical protein
MNLPKTPNYTIIKLNPQKVKNVQTEKRFCSGRAKTDFWRFRNPFGKMKIFPGRKTNFMVMARNSFKITSS